MFPLIAQYRELFNIDSSIKELLHLIYCKSLLDRLVLDDVPEAWFGLDYSALKSEIADLDFFSKSIVFGLMRKHLEFSDLKHHNWIHLPLPNIKKEDLFYSRRLGATEFMMPFGVYEGYEASRLYPTIAAIHLFVGYYGNPLLNQLRDWQQSKSGIRSSGLSDLEEYVLDYLNEHLDKTGGEYRPYQAITTQSYKDTFFKAQLFFDEPSLYSEKGDRYLKSFLDTINELEEAYCNGSSGLSEVVNNSYQSIKSLRSISSLNKALEAYENQEEQVSFFPLFAWECFDHSKLSEALDEEEQRLLDQIAISDSKVDSVKVNHDLQIDKLKKELSENAIAEEQKKVDSPDDLIELRRKKGLFGGVYYPYLQLYQTILRLRVIPRVLNRIMPDTNPTLFSRMVHLEGKSKQDLAWLAAVLYRMSFFKTKKEAAAYVASHFSVNGKDGLRQEYTAGSLLKSLEQSKNAVQKKRFESLLANLKKEIEE